MHNPPLVDYKEALTGIVDLHPCTLVIDELKLILGHHNTQPRWNQPPSAVSIRSGAPVRL